MCICHSVTKLMCFFTIVTCQGLSYFSQSYARIPRQVSDSRCQLPEHPALGKWTIYGGNPRPPGEHVPSETLLQVTCRDNYKLDGPSTIACINGNWTSKVGQCLGTCPSIHNTSTTTVRYTYNNRQLETHTDVFSGTKAEFRCVDFYEDEKFVQNPTSVCFNGRWSRGTAQCTPICGKKAKSKAGGKNITEEEYPWRVAIYNITDKKLLCSGSLLNERVVLTAANCITTIDGELLPKELFMVAVGKTYEEYDDPKDSKQAQFSEVYQMFVTRSYHGHIQEFSSNLAILVTKKTFKISPGVQPICIDWGLKFANLTYPEIGYMTGSYADKNSENCSLSKLLDAKSCKGTLPSDYQSYLTADKICGRFIDENSCKIEAGEGLVVKNENRFYLVGVASVSPLVPLQATLYTRVSDYINSFILEKEVQFRPDYEICESTDCQATHTTTRNPRGSCTLPQHPENGQWSILTAHRNLPPGTRVDMKTVIRTTCNENYKLDGEQNSVCENGKWSPEIGNCYSNHQNSVYQIFTSVSRNLSF